MGLILQQCRKDVNMWKKLRRDPFELPDDLLIAEYRLNKKLIVELCDMLRPRLARKTNRSKALTTEEQVMICLKVLASGSF